MTSRKIRRMIVSIDTLLDYIQEEPQSRVYTTKERDALVSIKMRLDGELMLRKAMKVKR